MSMKMPGLTAEAAVHDTGAMYRMATALEAPAKGAVVTPQACVNIGPCRVCVTVRIFPPRACLTFSCLGFNRSFCVP
jgi:hypothetical protein